MMIEVDSEPVRYAWHRVRFSCTLPVQFRRSVAQSIDWLAVSKKSVSPDPCLALILAKGTENLRREAGNISVLSPFLTLQKKTQDSLRKAFSGRIADTSFLERTIAGKRQFEGGRYAQGTPRRNEKACFWPFATERRR